MANTTQGIYAPTDPTAPQIAVDAIAGQEFQRVKFGWGPEGTYHETNFDSWAAYDAGSGTDDELIAAANVGLILGGFSARETTTTARGTFHIRNGIDPSGPILVTISLAEGESTREWPGYLGVSAPGGLYLERISGDIQVIVYSKVVS